MRSLKTNECRPFLEFGVVCKKRMTLALNSIKSRRSLVAHASESERIGLRIKFFRTRRSFVLWLRKVRFFNILPLFPLFLVASFCLFH